MFGETAEPPAGQAIRIPIIAIRVLIIAIRVPIIAIRVPIIAIRVPIIVIRVPIIALPLQITRAAGAAADLDRGRGGAILGIAHRVHDQVQVAGRSAGPVPEPRPPCSRRGTQRAATVPARGLFIYYVYIMFIYLLLIYALPVLINGRATVDGRLS